MTWLRAILLYPLAMVYNVITGIRNRLYDRGLKPAASFDLPVIGVGNLSVGGTGKTPMIEYLIRLLANEHTLATLSRGYGRKTKGFRIAAANDTAETLGDEPLQFYQKFGNAITVAVGEERAFAIPNILHEHPRTSIILLDDAFQHRAVTPSLNILLSDSGRPFYSDFVLPAGNLRESRNGADRADVVVITKCSPDITDDAMMEIEQRVKRYVQKPIFFSTVRYASPVPLSPASKRLGDTIVLVTGIANPKPLLQHVRERYNVLKHIDFADHHRYTAADVDGLYNLIKDKPDVSILTTEKDKVKLADAFLAAGVNKLPLFYLPIELEFVKNGQDFDEIVLNSLKRA